MRAKCKHRNNFFHEECIMLKILVTLNISVYEVCVLLYNDSSTLDSAHYVNKIWEFFEHH